MVRKKISVLFICALLCVLILSGCGRSLVISTGFVRGEVFRLGKSGCKVAELRVYLLDLQKQSEAMFGEAIWKSADREGLQQAVREQALAQVTRVKALNLIGVSRNVMLTTEEERLAEEAEHNYYAALSNAEKKYIDLDERNLQRMFREYALAEKTWRSLGDSAEEFYRDFYEKTQCDLNVKLWQNISLKKVEGNIEAPGFSRCYRNMFAEQIPAGEKPAEGEQAEGEPAAEEQAEEGPAEGESPEGGSSEKKAPEQ